MTRDERTFMEAALRQQEEMEKCKNDPVYFFNTYVKPKDQPNMTKGEYELFCKIEEARRNKRYVGRLHGRRGPIYYSYPMLPDFLKKP